MGTFRKEPAETDVARRPPPGGVYGVFRPFARDQIRDHVALTLIRQCRPKGRHPVATFADHLLHGVIVDRLAVLQLRALEQPLERRADDSLVAIRAVAAGALIENGLALGGVARL